MLLSRRTCIDIFLFAVRCHTWSEINHVDGELSPAGRTVALDGRAETLISLAINLTSRARAILITPRGWADVHVRGVWNAEPDPQQLENERPIRRPYEVNMK